jgi:hypothetical protein
MAWILFFSLAFLSGCWVTKKCSVTDPICLSRIQQQHQLRGGGLFLPFLYNYHKTVKNFIFEQVNNFFVSKTLRIVVLFYPKIYH